MRALAWIGFGGDVDRVVGADDESELRVFNFFAHFLHLNKSGNYCIMPTDRLLAVQKGKRLWPLLFAFTKWMNYSCNVS